MTLGMGMGTDRAAGAREDWWKIVRSISTVVIQLSSESSLVPMPLKLLVSPSFLQVFAPRALPVFTAVSTTTDTHECVQARRGR